VIFALNFHTFSKTAHVAYGAFNNAESAYQLPHHPLMSGNISSGGSEDDGMYPGIGPT
jgi:hypothetical protein